MGATLTFEETAALARKAQAGDVVARNDLAEANVGLVRAFIAKRKHLIPIDFDDAFQEGMIALLKAATQWDPDRDVKLSTYAQKSIARAIQRAAENTASVVRVPVQSNKPRTSEKYTNDVQRARYGTVSYDALIQECSVDDPPDAAAERRDALEAVQRELAKLPAYRRRLVERRFGLDGREPGETHAAVADEFQISRQSATAIGTATIRMLRERLVS